MQPKLLMARAAAPIFKGLRVATRTTRRLSKSAGEFMSAYSKTLRFRLPKLTWQQQKSNVAENWFGRMALLPLPSSGHWHKGNDAMLPPKLILSPIDFSESSHAALDVAADFATRFGAELLLVHVQPAISDLPEVCPC